MMSPKSNFKEMTLQELRHYVLAHRDDRQAWKEYASRPRPNAIEFEADLPLAEVEPKLRELLEKKA